MTGFGAGEHAATPHGKVHVELRALNHRYLEVRVRASRDLADLTTAAEMLVRERFGRGRFEVVLHGEGLAAAAPTLDKDRARRAYKELCALRDEIAPGENVPLSMLSAVPDLFATRDAACGELREVLGKAFAAAARDLDAMREREGKALERDMREHLGKTIALLGEIEARAPEAVVVTQKRLRERVTRLHDGGADVVRLEQEIALLADRSDVAEELARLRSHCEQLGEVLSATAPVGRRIDFLLQEMTREANTIGSKSADVGIARSVVELKVEIERMREQTQNVE